MLVYYFFFFFFKQKTAYEMRISDWSSDVCSSDLAGRQLLVEPGSVEVGCPGALAIAAGKAPRLVERQMAWMGAQKIGRASCRERCVSTCRSRWSPYH